MGSFVLLGVAAFMWAYWGLYRLLRWDRSEEEIHRMEMRGGRDAEKAQQIADMDMRATLFAYGGWIMFAVFIGSVVVDLSR
jgi:hypothetical protein